MKLRMIQRLAFLIVLLATPAAWAAVGPGARGVLQQDAALALTAEQKAQINAIIRTTIREYNQALKAGRGKPDTERKLALIRRKSQQQAVAILNGKQRAIWDRLSTTTSAPKPPDKALSKADQIASRSLIIPSIAELKNPPTPSAFGPNAGMIKTRPHPPLGDAYVLLTDHDNPAAIEALNRLVRHRKGELVRTTSLGELFKRPAEFQRLRARLRELKPRYVAISPKLESYRENMHLAVLRLLAGLDADPELDAFPGYLMASAPTGLAGLINRTIGFRAIEPAELEPVSIGAIEDNDSRRYRSYQKAKVLQRMFEEQGKESPAIIITTGDSHAKRSDFPELSWKQREIAMLQTSGPRAHEELSAAATRELNKNNVLFMFGHGTVNRIVGTQISAFAQVDFSNELVFCGSCFSAASYRTDLRQTGNKPGGKHFAFHAMDNGAVMMLGHMGKCSGFPTVFPVAELTLDGLATGEAYQRIMNSMIQGRQFPDYYPEPAPQRPAKSNPANRLLCILWGDPALIPIKGNRSK